MNIDSRFRGNDRIYMNKIFIIILSIVGVLALIAIIAGFFIYYQIKTPLSGNDYEQEIIIEKGDSIKIIAQKLEDAQVIRGAFYFETYVWLKNKRNLQAGGYAFNPSLSIIEIADALVSGKVFRNDVKITIPEGFTIKQIDERLAGAGLIKPGEFLNFDVGPFVPSPPGVSDYHQLMAKEEGFLFPDTYFFSKTSSIKDIFKKMNDNFNKKITEEMLSEINRQGKSLFDIITMASIVQQEAVSVEEMSKIAGVFYNRLEIGMALQSDATINYITNKGMRQPLLEDTKIDSPYNTYKYRGLPPGPVCNPGLDAIMAAIYPEKNDYLYFLHPQDAPTVFSKTLEEHNANKAKWLK
jgi:UPF0755 protein